jgi:hypothetical protein
MGDEIACLPVHTCRSRSPHKASPARSAATRPGRPSPPVSRPRRDLPRWGRCWESHRARRYRPGVGEAFASVGASRDGTKLMLPSQSDVASGERFRSRLIHRLTVRLRASARARASRFSGMNTSSDIRPTSGRTGTGLEVDAGWSDTVVMLAPAPVPKEGSQPPMRRARTRRQSPAAR